jgi:hypothetical protein
VKSALSPATALRSGCPLPSWPLQWGVTGEVRFFSLSVGKRLISYLGEEEWVMVHSEAPPL